MVKDERRRGRRRRRSRRASESQSEIVFPFCKGVEGINAEEKSGTRR